MSELTPSRRALLRYCSIGAVAGLAGCSGDNDSPNGDEETPDPTETPVDTQTPQSNGESQDELGYTEAFQLAGDGTTAFRDWVIPGNPLSTVDGVTGVCAYRDFEVADQQEMSSLQEYRSTLSSEYGVEAESFVGELVVGVPEGDGQQLIQLGEFDADALAANFEARDIMSFQEEYRGYSVFEQRNGARIVTGPDAVIRAPNYEEYIDASKGDADRLTDVDEAVRHLFSVLPAGFQISVSRHENIEDLVLNGSSRHDLDENGNPNRTTRAFVFEDESAATVERAKEIISIGSTGYEEVLTEEQHRRMVMVEFVADWSSS